MGFSMYSKATGHSLSYLEGHPAISGAQTVHAFADSNGTGQHRPEKLHLMDGFTCKTETRMLVA